MRKIWRNKEKAVILDLKQVPIYMAIPKTAQKYTFEEYLEIDEKSELRNEYCYGKIYGFKGCNANHNRINLNLVMSLDNLHPKYETFCIEILTKIVSENVYYYPDVVVCFDEVRLGNEKIVHFPMLVAEILSEESSYRDCHEKLKNYLQNEFIQYYMVVSQTQVGIILYEKIGATCQVSIFSKITDIITLDKLAISIAVKDLYEDVFWEVND